MSRKTGSKDIGIRKSKFWAKTQFPFFFIRGTIVVASGNIAYIQPSPSIPIPHSAESH